MIETLDETYTVAMNMIEYGGSFVEALGRALLRADEENVQKIKDAWPEYWQRFARM